jgi:hypothetical protein
MKRAKSKPQMHNYLRKLRYMVKIGAIPSDAGAHLIDILHDRECGIYRRQRCDCNPTIKLKVSVPVTMN